MKFETIKPQKGSEIVMQHIKEQIKAGTYPPGSKLPTVVQFAESFQVGRSTIREALSGLKALGWVSIKHGGGSFVNEQLPAEDIFDAASGIFYMTELFQEVLEVRKYIEAGCAALAAERRTDDDLSKLQHALERMEASLGNEEASDHADFDFHLCIANATHNSLMISMMESMTERIQMSMKESRRLWFFADRATAVALLDEHWQIYNSIFIQDAALANERMIKHISKVERVVQQLSQTNDGPKNNKTTT